MLQWLATTAIGQFFKGLFGAGVQETNDAAARADEQALGQASQKSTDESAAVAAEQTLDKAAADPSGRAVTQKELDDGTL